MSSRDLWRLYTSEFEYAAWSNESTSQLSMLRDRFGRVVPNYMYPGNIGEPAVSRHLREHGFQPVYPFGRKFAVCVSHDVDILFTKGRKLDIVSSLVRLNPGRLKKSLRQNFSRSLDEELHLKHMNAIDQSFGVKPTYYFLSVEKENTEDFNYDLEEVTGLIKWLQAQNYEIGLHGSRRAAIDENELKKELNGIRKLVSEVHGYRNHFLKFETPRTWRLLESVGLQYDTTLGYSHVPGFRNGMCHPYQPYDCQEGRWMDIYEIPLIVMDVSFFLRMQLDAEMSFNLFKLLVDSVKDNNGVFTFLWHNNFLTAELRSLYEKCLAYLNSQQAWFATGKEIIDWWQDNGYFETQKELLVKTMKE